MASLQGTRALDTHMATYFANQDAAGVLTAMAALADPYIPGVMPVYSTNYLTTDPRFPLVIGVHAAIDATVQARCRLVAPSTRGRYKLSAIEIPTLSSTNEPASPHAYNDFRGNPVRVGGDGGKPEYISFESDNNPASATDQFIVAVLASQAPKPVPLPDGVIPMRFTCTAVAATANTWARRAITPAETLDAGDYEVYGGKALSTSAVGAGLAFVGSDLRVPIGCADTRTDVMHPFFQPGQLGVLGRFNDRTPPQLDLLLDLADNETQVLDLWLKKVA